MKALFALSLLMLLGVGFVRGQDDDETPICPSTTLFDEFEYTGVSNAKDRIELFALQVANIKAPGVIVGYGGRISEANEGRTIADELRDYLSAKGKAADISIMDGGHRPVKTIELFIKPTCGDQPEPTSTLSSDEVQYNEEKTFFEKSGAPKPSSEMRGLARDLIDPSYPPAARAVRAEGKVLLFVLVDEKGIVSKVKAIEGHPLLRIASENALRNTSFQKLYVGEKPISYGGKFVIDWTEIRSCLESVADQDD